LAGRGRGLSAANGWRPGTEFNAQGGEKQFSSAAFEKSELDGYTVIVVQKRDLDGPQAVRQHLKSIALAMHRADFAVNL
jgi:hypothetical protein